VALTVENGEDCEAGEFWTVIEVSVRNSVDEVLEQYDAYTEAWVTGPWWPDSDGIRLSYDII